MDYTLTADYINDSLTVQDAGVMAGRRIFVQPSIIAIDTFQSVTFPATTVIAAFNFSLNSNFTDSKFRIRRKVVAGDIVSTETLQSNIVKIIRSLDSEPLLVDALYYGTFGRAFLSLTADMASISSTLYSVNFKKNKAIKADRIISALYVQDANIFVLGRAVGDCCDIYLSAIHNSNFERPSNLGIIPNLECAETAQIAFQNKFNVLSSCGNDGYLSEVLWFINPLTTGVNCVTPSPVNDTETQ